MAVSFDPSQPDQVEAGLIEYLKMIDAAHGEHQRRPLPWVSRVLQHGRLWDAAPAEAHPPRGEQGQCYKNAYSAARTDRLIYCEGWAVPDNECPFPVLHAWLINAQGQALEVTWERPGIAYCGIPFQRLWHLQQSLEQRCYEVCEQINPLIPEDPREWLHPVADKGRQINA